VLLSSKIARRNIRKHIAFVIFCVRVLKSTTFIAIDKAAPISTGLTVPPFFSINLKNDKERISARNLNGSF
jgi:hypothetical protein